MTTVTCEKCGGVYHPIQPDGSLYTHVCPPPTPPAPAPPRPGLLTRIRDWLLGRRREA